VYCSILTSLGNIWKDLHVLGYESIEKWNIIYILN
jgi:hypothetical protein